MKHTALHQPVMVEEVIEHLQIKKNHWYIDATFGRGGHTSKILERGGCVIAFDHDLESTEFAQTQFQESIDQEKLIIVNENFNKLTSSIRERKLTHPISAILFDFGTSVDQLKDINRGFSFEHEASLDMRMDKRLGIQAKDLLAILSEKQLEDLFRNDGGEEEARAIAKAITRQREHTPIETTLQLRELIARTKHQKRTHLNPATKVFQALRIAVNSEMENIAEVLPQAFEILGPNGRIISISFHEGEDRIVKNQFKEWEHHNKGQQLTKKPLQPTEEEIHKNPRSRSAKLRVFIKNNL